MHRYVLIGANGFIAKNFSEYLIKLDLNFSYINFREIFSNNSLSDQEKKKILVSNLKANDILIFLSSPAHTSIKKNKIEIFLKNFKLFLLFLKDIKFHKIIFISSTKVIDENSLSEKLFSYSFPNPKSAYGKYKLNSEKILQNFSHKFNYKYIILRLPLVLGKGVKGNFKKLIFFIKLGLPLPRELLNNKRNFISSTNLNNILIKIANNDHLFNITLTINDGNNYKMSFIIDLIYKSLNKKSKLSDSYFFMQIITLFFKKTSTYDKIFSDYTIDCSQDLKKIDFIPIDDIYKSILDSTKI